MCSVQLWPVSGGPPLFGHRTQCSLLGHALPASQPHWRDSLVFICAEGMILALMLHSAQPQTWVLMVVWGSGWSHMRRMMECCAGGAASEPALVSNLWHRISITNRWSSNHSHPNLSRAVAPFRRYNLGKDGTRRCVPLARNSAPCSGISCALGFAQFRRLRHRVWLACSERRADGSNKRAGTMRKGAKVFPAWGQPVCATRRDRACERTLPNGQNRKPRKLSGNFSSHWRAILTSIIYLQCFCMILASCNEIDGSPLFIYLFPFAIIVGKSIGGSIRREAHRGNRRIKRYRATTKTTTRPRRSEPAAERTRRGSRPRGKRKLTLASLFKRAPYLFQDSTDKMHRESLA